MPSDNARCPSGRQNSILMAPSVTSTMPSSATCFCARLANKIVGGPASLNHSGRIFYKRSALVTRQMRAAAVLWMPVRESHAPAMRCATLEIIWLQLVAMLIDISKIATQVSRHEDDSDVVSICTADLCIETIGEWNPEPAEMVDEGRAADPSNRASINTGVPLFGTSMTSLTRTRPGWSWQSMRTIIKRRRY